jgi:hypothetical protein
MAGNGFKVEDHPRRAMYEETRAKRGRVDGGDGGGEDGDMSARLTALETKWETIVPTLSTKGDMAALGAEVHKMDASIKTWMIATVVGLMIGFGGLFLAMSNALKPAPAQQLTPQPTVIVVPAAPAASRP